MRKCRQFNLGIITLKLALAGVVVSEVQEEKRYQKVSKQLLCEPHVKLCRGLYKLPLL